MKINDVLLESKAVDEAGALARGAAKLGNMALAKVGWGGIKTKAQGALEVQKVANFLWKEYNRYLGQTKKPLNQGSLVTFLKAKKFPTDQALKVFKKEIIKARPRPVKPAATPAAAKSAELRADPYQVLERVFAKVDPNTGLGRDPSIIVNAAKAALYQAAADGAAQRASGQPAQKTGATPAAGAGAASYDSLKNSIANTKMTPDQRADLANFLLSLR